MNCRKISLARVAAVVAPLLLVGCQSQHTPITPPRQNSEVARVQNDAAYKLIREGKYDAAEDILKNALAADVMYGPARNNLGLVYYHRGEWYKAAWEFENAIKLMPHQPEVRNNLGLTLEEAGKLREATESYQRARELEPDNPEFIGNLARARLKQNLRDDETRRLLQELVYKDTRRTWVEWAKESLIHIPPPGQDIVTIPTTRPAK